MSIKFSGLIDSFLKMIGMKYILIWSCLQLFSFIPQLTYGQAAELTGTKRFEIYSNTVQDSFTISIYIPPGQAPELLPVLYVFDADMLFAMVYDIVRWLQWGKKIPPVALVGIGYGKDQNTWWNKRSRDFTAMPDSSEVWGRWPLAGGSANFIKFLSKELKPHLSPNYGLSATQHIFLGISFGGLLGAHILFTQPELFDKYILLGPALKWNHADIFNLYRHYTPNQSALKAQVFTAVGALDSPHILEPWKQFVEVLSSWSHAGLTLDSWLIPGEDHFSMLPVALPRSLQAVLKK